MSLLQPQTKRAALSAVWHTMPMSERNPKALEIGERMAHARNKMGLSQPRLAAIVRLTPGAIGQYETGRNLPRPENLEKIAVALGVSVEWLLTGGEPDELVKAQTVAELDFLRAFRNVPTSQHEVLRAMLVAMAKTAPATKK